MMENVQDYLYHYRSTVVSVYDGDSVTLMLDMGIEIYTRKKCRLFGINTPEIRGRNAKEQKEKGYIARDFVEEHLPVGEEIFIKTHKDKTGKYGRLLVTIFLKDSDKTLNGELLEEKLAVPYGEDIHQIL
jgi:micrococcal nuclease